MYPDTFRDLWPKIRSNLFEGTYAPSPVLRVEIPKPDGSKRPLGLPTVLDRMIQQAIAQVMRLIFERTLSAGTRVMASIRRFIERELRLTVNEKKSKVVQVEECGFLGFVFVRGKIRWSDKFFLEFKRRVRLFTGRSWFVSMEYPRLPDWAKIHSFLK